LIECDPDKVIGKGVVDKNLIGLGRRPGVPRPNRAVPTAIKLPSDRLDHILVRQEG